MDVSRERGLGSRENVRGTFLVTKLIYESSLTMNVGNRSTFLLSSVVCINIGSARLAAFYIHSLEKAKFSFSCTVFTETF